MIKLQRNRTAIPDTFRDPGRHDRLRELFEAARAGTLADAAVKKKLFSSGRWKDAKPQLQRESAGKCAFCETPTTAVYYGDVEHFRPKAIYWWLAYCYENYLFSCRVCNGKKSDQHILANARAPGPTVAGLSDAELFTLALKASPDPADAESLTTLTNALAAEGAFLPNPYEQNPEPFFTWKPDPVLREVTIAANPAHFRSANALLAAERVLDLNRDELRTLRWQTYEPLSKLRDIAALGGPSRPQVIDLLESLAKSEMPYAGMVRYFARDQWGLIP
ncbi:hypothetical protein ACFQX4_17480 [Roseomonas sp. GCM10028921]